ncbi:MAG: hypothetical protein A3I68_03250 [Candidatus Melainabacteria bacterium RIFCSPLOWO2_02_FULL_35_15]|nr:MAG: hypothetical protein A3F80_05315 [Candidatus Melainabacteria bacterium RIFCSPLOWO2_12_FULL_35_11]OGI13101.1 MAG: hypothetical protein A3I68_03250 [Candidatus Melainabacteria bacterium RIFCSPLOWO2_02_FULL_35_15]
MSEIKILDPLVTIAITTYNRPDLLCQALKSVIDQTYENIEIIVLDDCSNSEVQHLIQEFINIDSRVKYYHHNKNIGVNPNFNFALKTANGKYFMWLCDDDWIDKDYISLCLQSLINSPEYILVTGKTKFYWGDKFSHEGIKINLPDNSNIRRWMSFYLQVLGSGNPPNFGLIELNKLRNFKMPNVMGCDYILFSRVAYMGKIKTLENVCIHRRLGGMSETMEKMALSFSLPEFDRKFGFVSLWINLFKDLLFNPLFHQLNLFRKTYIACKLNLLFCFNIFDYFKKYKMRKS